MVAYYFLRYFLYSFACVYVPVSEDEIALNDPSASDDFRRVYV
jgi:hypothetical protein